MGIGTRVVSAGAAFICGSAIGVAVASAQDGGSSLQEQAQNPIASLISVPFQNNLNFNTGELDATQYVLNIQPVVPAHLGPNWNLISRPIIPVVYQPKLVPGGDSVFGLSDIQTQFFFSPTRPAATAFGDVTWGVGPVLQFPSATDGALGTGKWSAGPAAVVFVSKAPWTYGGLITNIWSFAGQSERPDVNLLTMQPFLNFNLPNGWAIGTAPIITANWEADSDDRWTVPLGGGVSKLFTVGRQPVNAILRGYYNVVRPDNGPEWQLQFQVNLLFPAG